MTIPPPCPLSLHILLSVGLLFSLFLPQDTINALSDFLGLVAATAFSAVGLFLTTVSRNSPTFQTLSSMIMMPLTFVSGAYIPTTVMPKLLLPIVYLNPLTYTTSAFRFIALHAYTLTTEEMVNQGIAFSIGGFVITPLIGLAITVLIGVFFFILCVHKFNRADFSSIKVSTGMRGGAPAR